MAGDWIPMRLDLDEDPTVLEVASKLDLSVWEVVGRCWRVWAWASRHCNADVTVGVTLLYIDMATHVGLAFLQCLANADAGSWIDVIEVDGKPALRFPNWDRWLSKTAKQRAVTAMRVRRHREQMDEENGNGPVTPQSLPQDSTEEYKKPPNTPPSAKPLPKRKTYGKQFGKWYLSYPKKRSKAEAAKKYPKAVQQVIKDRGVSEDEAHGILVNAAEQYSERMAGSDPQFIKHPSTWLNQGCWDDEPDKQPSKVATAEDLANWRP